MTIQKAERSASPPGTAPGKPGSASSDPPGRSLLPPRLPAPVFACPKVVTKTENSRAAQVYGVTTERPRVAAGHGEGLGSGKMRAE